MATVDQQRYRANRQGEIDSAWVYRAMAAGEPDRRLATVYRRLAEVEERHLAFWEERLRAQGVEPGPRQPGWRARVMGVLARRFGARLVLPSVATFEQADQSGYDDQPETALTAMPAQERSHARVLRFIASGSPTGLAGETLARLEGRHRAIAGNALRAAVLGANDGLTTNLALVAGLAGAGLRASGVVVAGLTALVAGACSMAIGEWISMQSARELYERQMRAEAAEIRSVPDEEREELSLIYQAKGLPEEEAARLASRLMEDESAALDALAREELGLDPSMLGGSPYSAAGTSFALFALGAGVPLVPYLAATGTGAIVESVAAAAGALFLLGGLITLLTGRSFFYSGARQLVFGLAAAALTFGIGHLLGTAIT